MANQSILEQSREETVRQSGNHLTLNLNKAANYLAIKWISVLVTWLISYYEQIADIQQSSLSIMKAVSQPTS